MNNLLSQLILYLLEGLAITVALYLVTKKKLNIKEIAILSLTITATVVILDNFAPLVSKGARQGMGLGIGVSQVSPSMIVGGASPTMPAVNDATAMANVPSDVVGAFSTDTSGVQPYAGHSEVSPL